MSTILIKVGLWIARLGGWRPAPAARVQAPAPALLENARFFVAHVDEKFPRESGEFKRGQALRVLLNKHPEARERDCAWAIEHAIQERD